MIGDAVLVDKGTLLRNRLDVARILLLLCLNKMQPGEIKVVVGRRNFYVRVESEPNPKDSMWIDDILGLKPEVEIQAEGTPSMSPIRSGGTGKLIDNRGKAVVKSKLRRLSNVTPNLNGKLIIGKERMGKSCKWTLGEVTSSSIEDDFEEGCLVTTGNPESECSKHVKFLDWVDGDGPEVRRASDSNQDPSYVVHNLGLLEERSKTLDPIVTGLREGLVEDAFITPSKGPNNSEAGRDLFSVDYFEEEEVQIKIDSLEENRRLEEEREASQHEMLHVRSKRQGLQNMGGMKVSVDNQFREEEEEVSVVEWKLEAGKTKVFESSAQLSTKEPKLLRRRKLRILRIFVIKRWMKK
ncbi:hypothetical protein Q3G72_012207 [Acer saccharum]|nr:hypothetical protein Q3G72_012207 [Acer saccharum]